LAFRIGVLNPEYDGFPSSDKMKELVGKVREDIIAAEGSTSTVSDETEAHQQLDVEDMDVSDDEADNALWREAYLDELSHRYLGYTHGTVVEFTQEDGCVGLPEPIARALLIPNNYSLVGTDRHKITIPTKRTVDPAFITTAEENGHANTSEVEKYIATNSDAPADNDDGEKTPGHPAYGKFDIPSCPMEITPIKSLPPGVDCTFTPTEQSIKNGFYALKDVKLVLEQSLMRTRATLSRGDVIRTWRRGVSFDLIVSKVSPVEYGSVSCVNTDLNVDIGPQDGMETVAGDPEGSGKPQHVASASKNDFSGRMLSEPPRQTNKPSPDVPSSISNPIELPPEPAENDIAGVCVVQIRGRGSNSGRRRFHVGTATMGNLFTFASQVAGEGLFDDVTSFRLVTRFPRKVFRLSATGGDDCYRVEDTMESAGIAEGQVLFMIEQI
jgi:hypothetical protein